MGHHSKALRYAACRLTETGNGLSQGTGRVSHKHRKGKKKKAGVAVLTGQRP